MSSTPVSALKRCIIPKACCHSASVLSISCDAGLKPPEQVRRQGEEPLRRQPVGDLADHLIDPENFLNDDNAGSPAGARAGQIGRERAVTTLDGNILSGHPRFPKLSGALLLLLLGLYRQGQHLAQRHRAGDGLSSNWHCAGRYRPWADRSAAACRLAGWPVRQVLAGLRSPPATGWAKPWPTEVWMNSWVRALLAADHQNDDLQSRWRNIPARSTSRRRST